MKKFAVCAWMQIAVICKIKTNISEILKVSPLFKLNFRHCICVALFIILESQLRYGIKTTSYAHKTTSYAHKTTSYANKTSSYAHKATSYAHKTTSYAFKTYKFDSWN